LLLGLIYNWLVILHCLPYTLRRQSFELESLLIVIGRGRFLKLCGRRYRLNRVMLVANVL